MLRLRPGARPVPDGARTITIHDSAPRESHPADPSSEDDSNATHSPVVDNDERDPAAPVLVLNLQGGPKNKSKSGKRVVWKEDVIDNEGCGKKKSKICCIYNKPRRWDESSDESSDESDSGPSRRRNHNHDHDGHNHDHDHGHGDGGDNNASTSSSGGTATASSSSTTTVTTSDSYEPNAYERQPHHRRPDPSN